MNSTCLRALRVLVTPDGSLDKVVDMLNLPTYDMNRVSRVDRESRDATRTELARRKKEFEAYIGNLESLLADIRARMLGELSRYGVELVWDGPGSIAESPPHQQDSELSVLSAWIARSK